MSLTHLFVSFDLAQDFSSGACPCGTLTTQLWMTVILVWVSILSVITFIVILVLICWCMFGTGMRAREEKTPIIVHSNGFDTLSARSHMSRAGSASIHRAGSTTLSSFMKPSGGEREEGIGRESLRSNLSAEYTISKVHDDGSPASPSTRAVEQNW